MGSASHLNSQFLCKIRPLSLMVSGVPYSTNMSVSHNAVIIWNEVTPGTETNEKYQSWACKIYLDLFKESRSSLLVTAASM